MRRSMLFIPGNNPAMLLNADIHQADAIILDLEDAVSPSEKDAARILVRNALRSLPYEKTEIIVRLNPLGTPYLEEDLHTIMPEMPALFMPTKVSSDQDIHQLCKMMAEVEAKHGLKTEGIGLIPLLETAEGIENAYAIAKSSPRVRALFLGAEDLTSDLGAIRSKEGEEIRYARGRIVMAARAAGIEVYDTPFTDVRDDEGMEKDAIFARSLGFTGKASISPRHVPTINAVFTPSEAEIAYAKQVMRAIKEAEKQGKGAIALHGKMIDKPIVDRAKRVLEVARALGLGGIDDE